MKKRKKLSKRSTNPEKKNARAWVKAVNLYIPVPVKGNEWRGSISVATKFTLVYGPLFPILQGRLQS